MKKDAIDLHIWADLIPQVIWLADLGGELYYYNEVWSEFSGVASGMRGDAVWVPFLHPDTAVEDLAKWRKSVATGDEFMHEMRLRRRDGMYGWFKCHARRGGDRWAGVSTDITAQREGARLQEELRAHARELSESNRRKEQFLGMLGHELRNPLSVISNAAMLLDKIGGDDPDEVDVREMIAKHARHLGRLVDDLLDVSRFTKGKINLRKTAFFIRDAIKQGVEASARYMEEKGHDFGCSVSPQDPLMVCADRDRIAQVVTNLLHNAAKYTPERGKITLSLERHQHWVKVVVQDNGIGINPANLGSIFDLFAQADTTIDRASGGLGIGLTLVRNIMMAHGGGAWAESAGKGLGSRFVVQLPLLECLAGSPARQSEQPRRRRILVVDDLADAANSMSMLLKLQGHEVYTANDGHETLRQMESSRPDVVLLDIGIPEMNGYEIARRIRTTNREVLLIAVTGFGSDEDRRRSGEAGFNVHLLKPVEPRDIAEYIK